ncbi:DUF3800 domain-containing protein [Peribacillus frigoritolerans]|uniref:DUF3800 domain-containing protein n=1 Tax=Peribacillus frigoritolerans TaxID=450367 RepID=UPI003872066C
MNSKQQKVKDIVDLDISNEKDLAKELKRDKDKKLLQVKVLSGELDTMLSKVAYILNLYPDTRNSDITLQLKYWEEYQGFKQGERLDPEKMYELERLTSITRARAKIQNEYKLYLSTSEKVKRFRQNKEEIEKEKALATKPSVPSIHVYADESGKTGQEAFALVGSLWIPDTAKARSLNLYLKEWVRLKVAEGVKVPKEFHFTEMKKMQLDIYKEFFNEILSQSDVFSYKVVAANKSKIRDKSLDDIIFSLYYQIIHLGIEHETSTGRMALPRDVYYYKDEDAGTDKLKMAELRQTLTDRFKVSFEDKLKLIDFSSLPSKSFYLVQIADLITGSVSRFMNRKKDAPRNFKDEFAEYVLTELEFNFQKYKADYIDENFDFVIEKDRAYVHVFD